jgi:hypothetical protein
MLTAERRAKLTKYLEEAEEALHLVSMGQSVRVFVDQTGERVEYGPANAQQLNKYIYTLKVQLGLITQGPLTTWMA